MKPAPPRRRKLNAWGFEGISFPPPRPMRKWLEERLGPPERRSAVDPASIRLEAPQTLPDLPVPVSSEQADRLLHARGRGFSDLVQLRTGTLPALPDAVARPEDAADVEEVLRLCSREGVRVIPWGGGTSVTGAVNTQPDAAPAVVLALERLSGLVRLDARSGLARVRAGTLGPALEAALAPHRLTLGHFPQSWELSTLGGWVATRSAGQESLGFGRIEDMVAGLELVAPAGRLALPDVPASAAGPDLRQLVLGSEGRFGVITEVTVRVWPRPARRAVEAYLLPGWEDGVDAVREMALAGLPLHMIRLSDPTETEVALAVGIGGHVWAPLARGFLRLKGAGPGSCLLLCTAAGGHREIRWALGESRSLLKKRKAVSLGEGPGQRWLADRFRHPYLRDGLLDLGWATDTLETAASWSALPGLYRSVRLALASALPDEEVPVLCHVSHLYRDGASLYFTFFFRDAEDPEESIARWATLKRAATSAIVGAEGTLSHHHGIGSWHAPWYPREAGADGVRLLAAAARELDPQGILNPHVLFDPADRLEV
ncbi:MAG TPA: FAD-binding oxidoreductase [Thermoanaerobaculia bacterium]|nr:FAD-binding oxidoreductase [Thermoanaerobaculia bacterium]